VAACFASVVTWAGFGAIIGRFLSNPRVRIAFNWSMAGLLALSLLPVFW
jgi:threonine/homoserine/homoserine lactone efflux protein